MDDDRMDRQAHAHAPTSTGLLDLPSSLLHQLLGTIPAEATWRGPERAQRRLSDRHALFQTCRQLARQVILSTPSLTLQFKHEAARNTLEARRIVLMELLAMRPEFCLVVRAHGPQPFPMELASHVTELTLSCKPQRFGIMGGQYGNDGSRWLEWSTFHCLRSLSVGQGTDEGDLDRLCMALKGGHLQNLQVLQCGDLDRPYNSIVFTRSSHAYWGFAGGTPLGCTLLQAMGSRIKLLRVSCEGLLPYVQHLTELQSAEVLVGETPAETLVALCSHPTLRSVKLVNRSHHADYYETSIKADLSTCVCNWSKLTLQDLQNPADWVRLPIIGIEELYIEGGIAIDDFEEEESLQALRTVVTQHLHKVTLTPTFVGTPQKRVGFKLCQLTDDTIVVASRLQSDCWLIVDDDTPPDDGPSSFVPALWAALPPCVVGVRFENITGVVWPSFWAGIPPTVRYVEVFSADWTGWAEGHKATEADMCNFVSRTPQHVETLTIFHGIKESQDWEEATVRAAAPEHLHLEFVYDHMLLLLHGWVDTEDLDDAHDDGNDAQQDDDVDGTPGNCVYQ